MIGRARGIERRAENLQRARRALDETFDRRRSPGGLTAYETALTEFRAALDLMYPPQFWSDLERLRNLDPTAIEPMLRFLEADPWCFRSGYAKEAILRFLPRHEFSEEQRDRIEAVSLHAVAAGDRREFQLSCKLARAVDAPSLRAALRERIRSNDPGVARRALWMLNGLRRPRLDASDMAVARTLMIQSLAAVAYPRWVSELAPRLFSDEWAAELIAVALKGGPESTPALRLLARFPQVHFEPDVRSALADRVLRAVDGKEETSWFEALSPRIDSPQFREALEDRTQHPDGDVQQRAAWVVNALRLEEEWQRRRTDP